MKSADAVNLGQPGTKSKSGLDRASLQEYQKNRATENTEIMKEIDTLRAEAVKIGLVKE